MPVAMTPTPLRDLRQPDSCAYGFPKKTRDHKTQPATCETCGASFMRAPVVSRPAQRFCGWACRPKDHIVKARAAKRVRQEERSNVLRAQEAQRVLERTWVRMEREALGEAKASVLTERLATECSLCGQSFRARREGVRMCPACRRDRAAAGPTCSQCGNAYTDTTHGRRCCPECAEATRRARKHRERVRRRTRARSIVKVSYRPHDIFERDGWRCHLCGKVTRRDKAVPHALAPTIDHLIPLAANGPDTPPNVATAHFECNWRRQDAGVAQLRLVA